MITPVSDSDAEPGIPPALDAIRAILGDIPGQDAQVLVVSDAPAADEREPRVQSTEGHRPPWLRDVPATAVAEFDVAGQTFHDPLDVDDPSPLTYPMCTIGTVFTSSGEQGSGVLVGPNLLLTAAHLAPWGIANWSMRFVPGYRAGTEPLGSSYVQSYRGYRTGADPVGHDYVICRLYTPLGRALGWMGSRSYAGAIEYVRHHHVTAGYPGADVQRPAVMPDLRVRAIDDTGPGTELEFAHPGDPGSGWCGGPLWVPDEAVITGILSGVRSTDDDTALVYSGGRAMVDLIRYGMAHWPAAGAPVNGAGRPS